MSLITVDFKNKKKIEEPKAVAKKSPRLRVHTSKVFEVDFKNRTVLSMTEETEVTDLDQGLDFSDFKQVSPNTNFASFSPLERMEYSDHVLKHIKTLPLLDVVHFINAGMLDVRKASLKLGLPYRSIEG